MVFTKTIMGVALRSPLINSRWYTVPPIIMGVENGCISNMIVSWNLILGGRVFTPTVTPPTICSIWLIWLCLTNWLNPPKSGFHHVFLGFFSSGPQPWTLGARQSVPRSPKWKTTVDPCNVGKDRTGGIHWSLGDIYVGEKGDCLLGN